MLSVRTKEMPGKQKKIGEGYLLAFDYKNVVRLFKFTGCNRSKVVVKLLLRMLFSGYSFGNNIDL